jgi:hypothetical protein
MEVRPFVVRANHIKTKGFLTNDQIADIPVEKVFEWVRTGQWKQADFKTWLRVIRVIE